MEEKKQAKVVALGSAQTPEAKEEKKLTYEQLNDACNQLWQQNKRLAAKNRELEQYMMNKRLEYLFRVVENSDKFSSDFVVSCTSEIEEAITITAEEDKEQKESK